MNKSRQNSHFSMGKYFVEIVIYKTILANSKKEAVEMVKKKFKNYEVNINFLNDKRTVQQNNALHLWFQQLADALNEKGITAQQIFSRPVENFWTPEIVKEIWRKVQKAMFGKRSTTQLFKTGEIDKVYDVLNKLISERTNGEVVVPPFPSYENEEIKI